MTSDIDRGVRIADKYEIIGPLGRGAYGAVYRAIQHPVERLVALKVISPHAAMDEALRERFFREARAIARLNHPGVVTLHDYGESDGTLYMVMEFVDGRELKQIIKDEAPLPPERAFEYIRQVVTVLVEAHGLELIHRDLKPANIMVVRDAAGEERVKILDFGIAKLLDDNRGRFQTQMGTVVGSPSYFSPEQAMGEPCGPAADQYSVGVILYELLSGKKPFTGGSLMALVNAHRFEALPPLPAELGLPPAVMAFLRRAMEKQPADRFPDARAMLDALDTLHRTLFGTDRPSGQRPVAVSGRAAPAAPERRGKITAPLPGLDTDEARQISDSMAPTAETTPEPIRGVRPGADGAAPMSTPAEPKRTAALIALGSAHALYNEEAADPAPTPADGAPGLPGVEVFNASSTLIKPPPPPRRRSPAQVALVVGGVIVVLGLLGMWLLARSRSAPPEADAGPPDAAAIAPAPAPAAAPPGDAAAAAPVVDAAADGAAADGAPDAAPVDAQRPIERPRPLRRRTSPTPPPQRDPYEKM